MHRSCRWFVLNAALAGLSCGVVACHHPEQVQAVREPVLSSGDQRFITETQQLATRDRDLSTFVKGRSTSLNIKKYADVVITDDSSVLKKLDVLVQKYKSGLVTAPVVAPSNEEAKLKRLSHKALDRQFVNLIVEDDQHAVAMLQQETQSQADPGLRQYAIELLPMFESELKNAQRLETKPSSGTARRASGVHKDRAQISHTF